jgi:metal-sulfur cluster biosynthetic enzyme|nr:hypothetical protein [Oxalobacteraceae bacterium]
MDLVQHTFDLGLIETIKIEGTEKETVIKGSPTQDQSLVMEGNFAGPVAEFVGMFGMPNLGKLKVLLNLEEYRENARLTISRRETGEPEAINFENAAGDFRNSYRFMSASAANSQIKTVKFKGVSKWHVEFEPTVAGIQRLKWQASANAEEPNFTVKVDKGDLKLFFGDPSTHSGEFVFHTNIKGDIKRAWAFPVKVVLPILDLVGDKTFRISDDGCAQITVDSGLAVYNYILPAHSK